MKVFIGEKRIVSDLTKNLLVFVVVAVVLMSVFQNLSGINGINVQRQDYSDFLNQIPLTIQSRCFDLKVDSHL